MKVAILTQPLRTNYGGILQAYALQTVLQRMGHEVVIINREQQDYPSLRLLCLRLGAIIKSLVRRYILGQKECIIMNPLSSLFRTKWDGYVVLPFVKKRIIQSPELRNSKSLRHYFAKQKFDCYIVGSDQVWRPCYSPCITDFFLKSVPDNSSAKRIAYAASFGTDSCEFTTEELEECTYLLKKFDCISVREESGIEMCEKLFNISATHVLDPTMLLNKNDYVEIALGNGTIASPGNLFTYILDPSLDAECIIDDLVRDGYQQNNVVLRVNPTKDDFRPKQVSVEQWLRGFYEAKLIVTDSFHACVFSIIFQKPFIVIGNQERGNTRIDSLLKVFNLQMRKVLSAKDFEHRKNELIRKMDDNAIMEVLSKYRLQSDIFFSRSGLL